MKLLIDETNEGERIDTFLSGLMPEISRSKIQAEIKNNKITVSAKNVKPSYVLKLGDLIETSEIQSINKLEIKPEEIPLEIIWEDEMTMMINI